MFLFSLGQQSWFGKPINSDKLKKAIDVINNDNIVKVI